MDSQDISLRERKSSASKNSQTLEVNVGTFVENYHKLTDLLYPLTVVGNAIVYVIRWENYFLTLSILVFLSILLYFPALFFSFLTVLCIVLMGVGWYYGQTRAKYLAKKAKALQPECIDHDEQTMKKHHREQKNSHKALAECLRILDRANSYILSLTSGVKYLHRVALWESFEVSLCVTVLLCVVLVLLCTIYLRVISACLPLVILCSSKYFFQRTIVLLTTVYKSVIQLRKQDITNSKVEVKLDHSHQSLTSNDAVSLPSSSEEPEQQESVSPPPAGTGEDHEAEMNSTATATSGRVNTDSEDNSRGHSPPSTTRVRAAAQDGTLTDSLRDSAKPPLMSKGFCYKCNVSFAKLLKRKHDCNCCGQSFCGSCTIKVKKNLLGATSPAAYEESVRVCLDCESKLTKL